MKCVFSVRLQGSCPRAWGCAGYIASCHIHVPFSALFGISELKAC